MSTSCLPSKGVRGGWVIGGEGLAGLVAAHATTIDGCV